MDAKLNYIIAVLILVCLSSCTRHDLAPPPCTSTFKYESTSGVCKNCKGEIGFNTFRLAEVRKTKNAECLYLSKIELLKLLGDSVQFPQRFGYNKLVNYNFKGSVLDSCELFFNFIYSADLRGTDLHTLLYGYAIVKGRKDNFTRAPLAGTITMKGDSIFCTQ